jgi:hypothetical protein
MSVNRHCYFKRQKCDEERSRRDFKMPTELERMCDVKTKAIPEIMGPTGTISK